MVYFLALVVTVTIIIAFRHWYSYPYLKSSIDGRRTVAARPQAATR